RSGRATKRERRSRAVRVAVTFTQIEIDARVEDAAEDRVHDGDGEIVFAGTRDADVADADFRLHRLRQIDQINTRLGDRLRRPDGSCRLTRFLPIAEFLRGKIGGTRGIDVARDDQRE